MSYTIDLDRGRIAIGLIAAVTALAIASIWGSGLPLLLQLGLTIAVVLYGSWTLRFWPMVQRWRNVRIQTSGMLELSNHFNRRVRVEAGRGGMISPWFVSIQVKTADQKTHSVYGFYDQFDQQGYRHLLRHLRFHSSAGLF